MNARVEDSFGEQRTSLLQRVLRANAIFSSASGVILIGAAPNLARIMGIPWSPALTITGAILVPYGLALWWLAQRADSAPKLGWIAIVLDVLWVVSSAALVVGGWLPLTTAGIWIVVVLTEIVALFALLQYLGVRRLAAI